MLARKYHQEGARGAASDAPKRFVGTSMFLILCLPVQECRLQQGSAAPIIVFTKILPAAEGGAERVDTVAGRVRGARPGEHRRHARPKIVVASRLHLGLSQRCLCAYDRR